MQPELFVWYGGLWIDSMETRFQFIFIFDLN